MVLLNFIFFIVFPIFFNTTTFASPEQGVLISKLLKNYNTLILPVKSEKAPPVKLEIGVSLLQIIKVDEKHQILTSKIWLYANWPDISLVWNPKEFHNITEVQFPSNKIWTPDLITYNIADEEIYQSIHHRGSIISNIQHTGMVQFVPPMILKTTCSMEVTWFPFDEQKCEIIMGSWSYSANQIDIWLNEADPMDLSLYLPNGEWRLVNFTGERILKTYVDKTYVNIIFTIHIKRQSMYYFFNLIVPCALIGFLAVLGFTLPPDSGEKLSLGVTVLFSLIVFLNMIADSMPSNSDTVPLLGTYFNCVMFTIASSVVSTVVINLNLRTGHRPLQKFGGMSQILIFHWLPRILWLEPRMEFLTRNNNKVSPENPAAAPPTPAESSVISFVEMELGRIELGGGGLVEDHLPNVDTGSQTGTSADEDKILMDKWIFAAVVVDRLCLVLSIIFTLISCSAFVISSMV